jgi:hypothetical protein
MVKKGLNKIKSIVKTEKLGKANKNKTMDKLDEPTDKTKQIKGEEIIITHFFSSNFYHHGSGCTAITKTHMFHPAKISN